MCWTKYGTALFPDQKFYDQLLLQELYYFLNEDIYIST